MSAAHEREAPSRSRGGIELIQALPGARVAVDRVDADTVAAARLLRSRGATVVLLDRGRAARNPDALLLAEHEGLTVLQGRDVEPLRLPFDILLAHDYTSPQERVVVEARRSGRLVAHWADVLFELWPGPVIGVTGSAGKSTTTRLIAEILGRSGHSVVIPLQHALIDSANPNWEVLARAPTATADATLVVELTSSHLAYMSTSPDVAVITTVTPDHVEWHGSLAAYLEAKCHILDSQGSTGWAILNLDEEFARTALRDRVRGEVMWFGARRVPQPPSEGAYLHAGDIFLRRGHEPAALLSADEVALAPHYLSNALAASAAASALGAPLDAISSGLRSFRGLMHRHELIATIDGVSVVDDGIALTPRKALTALSGMAPQSVWLICGGDDIVAGWSVAPLHSSHDEAALLDDFCRATAAKAKHVFLLGRAAPRLQSAMTKNGVDERSITRAPSLEWATAAAIAGAVPRDTVLLAPVFDIGDDELNAFAAYAHKAIDTRRSGSR